MLPVTLFCKIVCSLTYRRQLFDELVRSTERRQPDFLRELCEGRISEEGSVAQQLVADVGFRSVERLAAVADVLCRVEDPECQAGQKVPRGQQTSHGAQGEASAVC